MNNGQNQRAKLQKSAERKSRNRKMKTQGRASTCEREGTMMRSMFGSSSIGNLFDGKSNGRDRAAKINLQKFADKAKRKRSLKNKQS